MVPEFWEVSLYEVLFQQGFIVVRGSRARHTSKGMVSCASLQHVIFPSSLLDHASGNGFMACLFGSIDVTRERVHTLQHGKNQQNGCATTNCPQNGGHTLISHLWCFFALAWVRVCVVLLRVASVLVC